MDPKDSAADFIAKYPSIEDLKNRARRRMPRFAYEYLTGGCNEDINLHKNMSEIHRVELMPQYLRKHEKSEIKTTLFGVEYSAPFGVAPIGLQGLMWPNSSEILAAAATRHNLPFILSTVTTCSIEKAGEITGGKHWFQLYHPAEDEKRDDLLKRAEQAGCPVLVALSDVPTFGFRPRDIRNGLSMPPKMTLRNIFDMTIRPTWVLKTLRYGKPNFQTIKPYMPKSLNMAELGKFMNQLFEGRLNEDKLSALRDLWKGKLVLKGVVSEEDVEKCIRIGVDGIIVSNHGGRQLDAGESTIKPLTRLAEKFGDKIVVMMDGGVRSGPDVARCIASGAKFVFMGRPFMYGVGALGKHGGNHAMAMLKMQLQQVMEQLCCERIEDLPQHLIKSALDASSNVS